MVGEGGRSISVAGGQHRVLRENSFFFQNGGRVEKAQISKNHPNEIRTPVSLGESLVRNDRLGNVGLWGGLGYFAVQKNCLT